MSVKDNLLKLLEENRGKAVSGETIAKDLNVSRAAVWKSVKSLREEGYDIQARTNSGYMLSESSDILSENAIKAYYSGDVHVLDEVDSTNSYAKKLAADGAAHGTLVVAKRQTNGRGRQGRSFCSPDGGVYMSVILRPDTDFSNGVLITTAAAVAVCRAIENLLPDSKVQIKWVNDVFFGDKKVCGILTEAVFDMESRSIGSVIVGIGVNLKTAESEFPEELLSTVTSLHGNSVSRSRLAAEIANELLAVCDSMSTGEYLDEYRERCFVIGKNISFVENNVWYDATAKTVDNTGGLVVTLNDGEEKTLRSGEVQIKNIEGILNR